MELIARQSQIYALLRIIINRVGVSKYIKPTEFDSEFYYVGNTTIPKGLAKFTYPLEGVDVVNWDYYDLLLQFAHKGITSKKAYVCIPTVKKHSKDMEKICELMFEKYEHESIGFSPSNYNCLVGDGTLDGCILEIGDALTSFCTYNDGITTAINTMKLGGK